MQNSIDEEIEPDMLSESFLAVLVLDVDSAMQRRSDNDDQSTRRELVRTLFVAIDGLVWTYREHVLSVARTVDVLTPGEEIALSEKGYTVTGDGKIVEVPRFIPLVPAIRLITRLATKTNPEFESHFDDAGWQKFREALKIRHRLTHPKSYADLALAPADMDISYGGFEWIFHLCLAAMESTTSVHKRYVAEFTTILEKLKEGDREVWAEYRAAAQIIAERRSLDT